MSDADLFIKLLPEILDGYHIEGYLLNPDGKIIGQL